MKLTSLAIKNIRGNGFRSVVIFLAVMGVSGFLLSTSLIIKGEQYSLDSGIKRLGADILVVPAGAETKVESALLMSKPTDVWMPTNNLQAVAAIPGVAAVSPQRYLASLYGAPCCSVSEMFIVMFDPATDFSINPWLTQNLGRELKKGEVIGGSYISVVPGEQYIKLYGYDLTLKGNLAPTGIGIDQTMFMTLETAEDMARSSLSTAVAPLVIPNNEISSILVKVAPGVDVHAIALEILRNTIGMVPVESPNLFGTFRNQMNGLLWGFLVITVVIWALSMFLIGLVFSMAANERRREMSVLRAIGASRSFVFQSLLAEAALVALSGAVVGIAFAATSIYMFRNMIATSLKMPFLFPSVPTFFTMFGAGVGLAILTVTLAALIPAVRISRQELAIAMRE